MAYDLYTTKLLYKVQIPQGRIDSGGGGKLPPWHSSFYKRWNIDLHMSNALYST